VLSVEWKMECGCMLLHLQMCGVRKDVVQRAHSALNMHTLHQQAKVPAAGASLALQQVATHWADELDQLDAFSSEDDAQQPPDAAAAVSFLMRVADQASRLVKPGPTSDALTIGPQLLTRSYSTSA
jgi:hypothetical protein